ncbi:DNA-binding transcriptional regulator, LysR family [Paraburkholderia susongensis]|uniref:DNA-binding transcriptional regulator, LysR family n=2 Tax=Paraburkholderia susongensis TaxID=1515439 RepID=A0A1X7JF04_9BURK|nr:DNA-binding transcriptional regulator, LysR family [Paraburkholderia susongensis]
MNFPRPDPEENDNGPIRAPDFSLRQLSYFLAAAQHQSVQKAAALLHVSSPAVSAAIAHLEGTLGVTLFNRQHARGLLLTEAGSEFAVQCRAVLQNANELLVPGTLDRSALRGQVKVGCLTTFAPLVIPALLNSVRAEIPNAKLTWTEGHHEYLIEGLRTGTLDLAVLYDFEIPSGIQIMTLRSAPLQVVLPPDHPLSSRTHIPAADINTEPFILLDLPRTREYMLSAFSSHGVLPRIAHAVTSLNMLFGLVAAGHGFSLLNFCPPYTVPGIGRIVSRPFDSHVRQPNIVVAHSYRYHYPRVAAAIVERIASIVDTLTIESP